MINHSEHAFTEGKLRLGNLLSFYSKVYDAMDNGESFDMLYLHFSKAFDKESHQRLLNEVTTHGIDGKILGWIKAWLSDRRHKVVKNSSNSGWDHVISRIAVMI